MDFFYSEIVVKKTIILNLLDKSFGAHTDFAAFPTLIQYSSEEQILNN